MKKTRLTKQLMELLANTGVKVFYKRKDETLVGKIVSGTFTDCLGKTFTKDLAFLSDAPYGKKGLFTVVSKDFDNKVFEVELLDGQAMDDVASCANTVLYKSVKTGEWIKGKLAKGRIVTALGDEYDKKLAFVADTPYGENGKYDINANKIRQKDIILLDIQEVAVSDDNKAVAPASTKCACAKCNCDKQQQDDDTKVILEQIKQKKRDILSLEKGLFSEDVLVFTETITTNKVSSAKCHNTELTGVETDASYGESGTEILNMSYFRKGSTITCKVSDITGKEIAIGKAICMDCDDFDYSIGINLAKLDARKQLMKLEKDFIISCIENI